MTDSRAVIPSALDLPEPAPAAQAHSAALVEHMRQAIEGVGGWISFAEYMRLALYAPGLGYYSAGATKLGEGGDFVTAPELSPLFSECVADQIAQGLKEMEGASGDELLRQRRAKFLAMGRNL